MTARVGIEWMPFASRELLREARHVADEYDLGLHLHLNESEQEVGLTQQRHARRPTELAYECGILGEDCVAAHGVWLHDDEIALLAETRTSLSHNPNANAKLGNGVARIPEILRAGVLVGLGNDGAESNNSRDLFQVMKFASLIHRATRTDATLLPAGEIFAMATRNGAVALHTGAGSVVAGATADLTVVDLGDLSFAPLDLDDPTQLLAHLVFSAQGSSVTTVVVDGKLVYHNRQLTRIDESDVRDNANRCFAEVRTKVGR